MPGYVMHLAEAKIIYDSFSGGKFQDICRMPEWRQMFFRGSLLPDAFPKQDKCASHFWGRGHTGEAVRLPDLDRYREKYGYGAFFRHPEEFGYYVHLYLDRVFWKTFMPEHAVFLDADQTEYHAAEEKAGYVTICRSGETIPIEDFFSEDYLYGDYTKANDLLSRRYLIAGITEELKYGARDIAFERDLGRDVQDSFRVLVNQVEMLLAPGEGAAGGSRIFTADEIADFLENTAGEITGDFLGKTVKKNGLSGSPMKIGWWLSLPFRCFFWNVDEGWRIIRKRLEKKAFLTSKKQEDALDAVKTGLVSDWKKYWTRNERQGLRLDTAPDGRFEELLECTYFFVKYEAEKNKRKNFRAKMFYIVICIVEAIVMILFVRMRFFVARPDYDEAWSVLKLFGESGAFVSLLFIFSRIVAKWLDIAKYQETWSRHSKHLHLMEREMLLYVNGMAPYHDKNRNEIFKTNMIGIWDTNQEKFADNMENKEKELEIK